MVPVLVGSDAWVSVDGEELGEEGGFSGVAVFGRRQRVIAIVPEFDEIRRLIVQIWRKYDESAKSPFLTKLFIVERQMLRRKGYLLALE